MREIYTAQLEYKTLLSASADCYHLEFTFADLAPAAIEPGQFLSLLADDAAGKTYTRAYSIASAPRSQSFDLCVNRVENGFFSNYLCDMREGDEVRCHGPHGLFTLRQPAADSLLIAAGTGIAPMRGFAQSLFPTTGEDCSKGHEYWLVYEAPRPEELFYDSYFQELAAQHPNFHYLPVAGEVGDHHEMIQEIARLTREIKPEALPAPDQPTTVHAYICGLSEMVKAARAELLALGWQKQQVLFERYD